MTHHQDAAFTSSEHTVVQIFGDGHGVSIGGGGISLVTRAFL